MGGRSSLVLDLERINFMAPHSTTFETQFWTQTTGLLMPPESLELRNIKMTSVGVFGGPIWRDKTFFFVSYEGLRLQQPQSQSIQVPSLAWRASATNPEAAAVLNAYPKPDANAPVSADGDASPFIGVWSNQITTDAVSLRIDHTLNTHFSIFGR